jgi:hypothetical protein
VEHNESVMPTPTCPKCRRTIPGDEINVAKDVAYCRDCNISYQLSTLTCGGSWEVDVDLQRPPGGAWYRADGAGTVIGASNRSLGTAFGALFFAVFWNGIVSVFVMIAIVSTFQNLHIPVPDWFPAPKMHGGTGPGMTIFLWLFLTPFICVGALVAATCLSSLFGRTEVKIENTRGTAFTGVGATGWKNRFDRSDVRDVQLNQTRNNQGRDSFAILITMKDGKELKFGSLLSPERRQFVLGALQRTLVK